MVTLQEKARICLPAALRGLDAALLGTNCEEP